MVAPLTPPPPSPPPPPPPPHPPQLTPYRAAFACCMCSVCDLLIAHPFNAPHPSMPPTLHAPPRWCLWGYICSPRALSQSERRLPTRRCVGGVPIDLPQSAHRLPSPSPHLASSIPGVEAGPCTQEEAAVGNVTS